MKEDKEVQINTLIALKSFPHPQGHRLRLINLLALNEKSLQPPKSAKVTHFYWCSEVGGGLRGGGCSWVSN